MNAAADSPLVARVLQLLEEQEAPHQVLRHEPVFTSEQAAQVRGTPLEDGAKALICQADDRRLLIVVPAPLRLDTKAFKATYGIKNLRMVPAEEVEALGAMVGGVPPFGHLMGLQTYADERLSERRQLSFNAGSRTTSVILPAEEYFRLERPIVGRFAGG